jgi:hypothetical protein
MLSLGADNDHICVVEKRRFGRKVLLACHRKSYLNTQSCSARSLTVNDHSTPSADNECDAFHLRDVFTDHLQLFITVPHNCLTVYTLYTVDAILCRSLVLSIPLYGTVWAHLADNRSNVSTDIE